MQHYYFNFKGKKFNRKDIKLLIKSVFDEALCFSPSLSQIDHIVSYPSGLLSWYIDFKISYTCYRLIIYRAIDSCFSAGLQLLSDGEIYLISSIPSYSFNDMLDKIIGG